MIEYVKVAHDMEKAQAIYNDFCKWLTQAPKKEKKAADRAKRLFNRVENKYHNVMMHFEFINNFRGEIEQENTCELMRKHLRELEMFCEQHKQSFPLTPSEYNKQKNKTL